MAPIVVKGTFVFDVNCPWTYMAKKRLARAVAEAQKQGLELTLSLTLLPYEVDSDLPGGEGLTKRDWYLERYAGDESRVGQLHSALQRLGKLDGISFDFSGRVARSIAPHRVLQHVQGDADEDNAKARAQASEILDAMYMACFEHGKLATAPEVLQAVVDIAPEHFASMESVERYLDSDEDRRLVERMAKIQRNDASEGVPVLTLEGRRTDHKLQGASTVEDYIALINNALSDR